MNAQEREFNKASAFRLPVLRNVAYLVVVTPEDAYLNQAIARFRDRTILQACKQTIKECDDGRPDLFFGLHHHGPKYRAHRRCCRDNSFGELHRIFADKPAGDVAQVLRASEGLLQLQQLPGTKKPLEVRHHRDIRPREPVDRLPIIANCKEMASWITYQCSTQPRSRPGCVLELISHDQPELRLAAPLLNVLSGLHEHVLEVQSTSAFQGYVPGVHHGPEDIQEHVVAMREEP
ncbi:hypothetical protein ALO90_200100 [Pseudomonas amygdali pv. aesculi]|nr:hypothetical protein ALO90_200100 [Pseudomonas amygdali pv. aesculi]